MRKAIILVVIILVFGGLYYTQKSKKVAVNPDISTYKNSNLGITFSYPKILTSSVNKNIIKLHHEVPFEHHDFCDFKGEATTTIKTLTDFNVSFYTVDKGLLDAMKMESPYIPEENFVNGNVIPSPGFIDEYNNGNMQGFSIFEGAEGCGHTIYYLKVSDKKTLIVKNDLITIFTGAIDTENMDRALQVPGVINKNLAEEIFDEILKTIKVE